VLPEAAITAISCLAGAILDSLCGYLYSSNQFTCLVCSVMF